jgi:hypothetical protein
MAIHVNLRCTSGGSGRCAEVGEEGFSLGGHRGWRGSQIRSSPCDFVKGNDTHCPKVTLGQAPVSNCPSRKRGKQGVSDILSAGGGSHSQHRAEWAASSSFRVAAAVGRGPSVPTLSRKEKFGAGEGIRTLDPNLGKVMVAASPA